MLCASLVAAFSVVYLLEQPPPARIDPEQQAAQSIQKQLGVEFSITESKIRRWIIRTKTPYGFKIKKVVANSKAAQADWRVGDVLMEWNEAPIKNLVDLEDGLKKAHEADNAKFKLSRYKNEPWRSRQPWKDIDSVIKLKS